jgi:hypothetical protein
MNSDVGKALFDSYAEASAVSTSLTRRHKRGFNVYKSGYKWAVGGVHTKRVVKVKSLADMRKLYHQSMGEHNETLVDDYIYDIEADSQKVETIVCGESDAWVLAEFAVKRGYDIGLNNGTDYLCVKVVRGSESLELKMGGKFSVYTPILVKRCEALLNKNIIWFTWNSRIKESNWSSSEWFYRIEEGET